MIMVQTKQNAGGLKFQTFTTQSVGVMACKFYLRLWGGNCYSVRIKRRWRESGSPGVDPPIGFLLSYSPQVIFRLKISSRLFPNFQSCDTNFTSATWTVKAALHMIHHENIRPTRAVTLFARGLDSMTLGIRLISNTHLLLFLLKRFFLHVA